MIDWIKTAQGVEAIVAAILVTTVAQWNLGLSRLVFSAEAARGAGSRRIEALAQFNLDTRLPVPDHAWWRANPLARLWPGRDAAFVMSGGGNGGPSAATGGRWSAGCRPLATKASWPPCRRHLGDVG
jgi:hypothetical protein